MTKTDVPNNVLRGSVLYTLLLMSVNHRRCPHCRTLRVVRFKLPLPAHLLNFMYIYNGPLGSQSLQTCSFNDTNHRLHLHTPTLSTHHQPRKQSYRKYLGIVDSINMTYTRSRDAKRKGPANAQNEAAGNAEHKEPDVPVIVKLKAQRFRERISDFK